MIPTIPWTCDMPPQWPSTLKKIKINEIFIVTTLWICPRCNPVVDCNWKQKVKRHQRLQPGGDTRQTPVLLPCLYTVYVFIHIHKHTHTHTHTCTHTRAHTHVHTHTYTHTHTHVRAHTLLFRHIFVFAYTSILSHIHTCSMRTCTCTYTHMNTHTQSLSHTHTTHRQRPSLSKGRSSKGRWTDARALEVMAKCSFSANSVQR